MNIAFFDFDGTITTKDSLVDFIRFGVGDIKFFAGMVRLSPMLLRYVFNLIPNHLAKERMISYFFKGMNESFFKKIAYQYSMERIDKIVRPQALEAIRRHQLNGDKVVVVSASIECWIKGWCDRNSLELIATQLEFVDNSVNGNFLSLNCYGPEKANRIQAQYNLNQFETIYAYGDTIGDKEMLALAHLPYYQSFEKVKK